MKAIQFHIPKVFQWNDITFLGFLGSKTFVEYPFLQGRISAANLLNTKKLQRGIFDSD